jgi:hypothetical protein
MQLAWLKYAIRFRRYSTLKIGAAAAGNEWEAHTGAIPRCNSQLSPFVKIAILLASLNRPGRFPALEIGRGDHL